MSYLDPGNWSDAIRPDQSGSYDWNNMKGCLPYPAVEMLRRSLVEKAFTNHNYSIIHPLMRIPIPPNKVLESLWLHAFNYSLGMVLNDEIVPPSLMKIEYQPFAVTWYENSGYASQNGWNTVQSFFDIYTDCHIPSSNTFFSSEWASNCFRILNHLKLGASPWSITAEDIFSQAVVSIQVSDLSPVSWSDVDSYHGCEYALTAVMHNEKVRGRVQYTSPNQDDTLYFLLEASKHYTSSSGYNYSFFPHGINDLWGNEIQVDLNKKWGRFNWISSDIGSLDTGYIEPSPSLPIFDHINGEWFFRYMCGTPNILGNHNFYFK